MENRMKKIGLSLLLLTAFTASAGTDPSNTFRLGDGNPAKDKKIIINQGTAPYPALKWNSGTGTLQFSNDGNNFSDLGSGSGSGGAGFNVLVNGDFESGIVLGFTHSGGTLAAVTSGANLLLGKGSALFTASGTGNIFASAFYPIPNGLAGSACTVSARYLGGGSSLLLQAFDGTNVLSSTPLPATTVSQTVSAPFICPASGTMQWRVISTGAAPAVALDTAFLGQNSILQVSQATYVGGVLSTGCSMTSTSTSVVSDMTSGGCSAISLVGKASSFASSGNGAITFNSLSPGEYVAQWYGTCETNTANTAVFIGTDGTSNSPIFSVSGTGVTGLFGPCVIQAHFSYTTGASQSFKLQALQTGSATGAVFDQGGTNAEFFSLFKYPSRSETAVRPDTINWIVDVSMTSPGLTDASIGNTTTTTPTPIQGPADLTLSVKPGFTNAQLACHGTAPSTGVTCAGTPDLGIAFNQPSAGTDEICFDYSHRGDLNAADVIGTNFVLVETPNNAETILQSGTQMDTDVWNVVSSQNAFGNAHTHCENFQFNSSGLKTIRLFYTQNITGTPTNNLVHTNQTPVRVTVRPLTQTIPAPILAGGVTSSAPGSTIIVAAHMDGSGNISRQMGNWLSSIVVNSTGDFTANFVPGVFSDAPYCVITPIDNGATSLVGYPFTVATTTTQRYIITAAGSLVTVQHNLVCYGQK